MRRDVAFGLKFALALSRFPLLASRILLSAAVAEVAEEGFEPFFALRGGEGAVALYREGLDAGEDIAVEL